MLLADLIDADAREVAALPVSVHAALTNEYAELQARVKRIGAVLDKGLELAYGGQNAPGTSHREVDGFDVKVSSPKRVEWDKDQLYELADQSDYGEYVDWTPSVSETRYKGAPQRVVDALEPARTVKMGKAKIEITKKEG
jgi:hypothetical protein